MESEKTEEVVSNRVNTPKLNSDATYIVLPVNIVHPNHDATSTQKLNLATELQTRVEPIFTPVTSDFASRRNSFVIPQEKWFPEAGGHNLPAVDFFSSSTMTSNWHISFAAINGDRANNSNYVGEGSNERTQNSAKQKSKSADNEEKSLPQISSAHSSKSRLPSRSTVTDRVSTTNQSDKEVPLRTPTPNAIKLNRRKTPSSSATTRSGSLINQKLFKAQPIRSPVYIKWRLSHQQSTPSGASKKWTLRRSTANAAIAAILRQDVHPINGMIKTYDNPKRQFTRPYSAKTVFFYKDGDEYFTGVRVSVTKERYRNINTLLDRLNETISLPYGVRQLHTPYGRTIIRSVDELKHLGKYVASSRRQPRGLDLAVLERRKREREINVRQVVQRPPAPFPSPSLQRRKRFAGSATFGNSAALKGFTTMSQSGGGTSAHFRGERTSGAPRLSYLPVAKQVFFTLNGQPSSVYRTVLNPLRRNNDFDALLEEVSESLRAPICRLFSYDGQRLHSLQQLMELKDARVLAVPRHQRPILPGKNSLPPLPPIFAWTTSATMTTDTTSTSRLAVVQRRFSTTSTRSNPQQTHHNDQKTLDDSVLTRRIAPPPWRLSGRISPLRLQAGIPQPLRNTSLSKIPKTMTNAPMETTTFSENGASNSNSSNHTNSNTMDSDSGRPKSILNLSDDNMAGAVSVLPRDSVKIYAAAASHREMRKRRSLSDPAKPFDQSPPPSRIPTKIFRSKSFRRSEKISYSTAEPRKVGQQKGIERQRRRFVHSQSQDLVPRRNRAATPPPTDALVRNRMRTRFNRLPIKATRSVDVSRRRREDDEALEEDEDEDDDYPKQDELKDAFFRRHLDSDPRIDKQNDADEGETDEVLNNHKDRNSSSDKKAGENDSNNLNKDSDSADYEEFDGILVHSYQQLDQVDEIENDKEFELIEAEHFAGFNDTQTSFDSQRMHTINEEEDSPPSDSKLQVSSQLTSSASAGDSEAEVLSITKAVTTSFSAATVIQRHVRGFLTRKKLKSLRFREDVDVIGEEISKREKIKDHSMNEGNVVLNNDKMATNASDELMNAENHHSPRLVTPAPVTLVAPAPVATSPSSDVQDSEAFVSVISDAGADRFSVSPQYIKTTYTYTITIKTGNRWAADTEADLHVVLYGDAAQFHRTVLRQECVNWLQSPQPKFRQNQTDSFRIEVPSRLGVIEKIVVSHEHSGYGAGIFIERIHISEESEDHGTAATGQDDDTDQNGLLDAASVKLGGYDGDGVRQFLFLCNKWLDSGQVDGKLERSFRLSAFCYIHSANTKRRTKGRWEFIFNNGLPSGSGGTTSNLRIIGYGTRGQSTTSNIYDTRMKEVPSESLVQVDFGNIGDLLKVRVEIDGMGASPDYFLNFLAMRDLDTDERFVVMCGKWLRWRSTERGAQPFRELLAFHYGIEPLPLIAYEGKLRVVPSRLRCFEDVIQMEFHGDLGETGVFSVALNSDMQRNESIDAVSLKSSKNSGSNKIEVAFKVEAVSIGRVYGARIFFRPTKLGAQLFEGFYVLQKVFESRLLAFECESTTSDWLMSSVVLRESYHTPYRYVLTKRKLVPQQQQSTFDVSKETAGSELYVMDLVNSEMEGVATRLRKSMRIHRGASNWVLSMLLGAGSTLLPDVVLCGERAEKSLEMRVLDATPVDDIISYQLKTDKGSALRKVRVSADGVKCLNVNPNARASTDGDGKFVAIRKMRLCDTVNGDELRFPNADVELGSKSVYEFSAIWPDYPPVPIVIFTVHIATGLANPADGGLNVCLNLRGQFGEVGLRTLTSASAISQNFFHCNSESAFEFEAVSIGEVKSAELCVDSKHDKFVWECRELIVDDSYSQNNYVFKFSRQFSEHHKVETAKRQ